MKKFLSILSVLLIATVVYSTVSAQENTGITFSIIKKDGKIMTDNALKQKVVDFYVIGLNSNEEVAAFIVKFKALKGVVDITISNDLVDNQRLASATFIEGANKALLKADLTYAGVKQIIVDGKTINTSEIKTKETEK